MSAKGKSLKDNYKQEAKSQWNKLIIVNDVELEVKLYFGDKRTRDIDNYGKILFDSLSGIVYQDDKQIQKLIITKYYDKDNPRVTIKVKEL
jgi:crossover junction endodeoxyribonuclease RusA